MKNINTKEVLFFRHMITPVIIQVLFWLGVLAALVSGVSNIFHGAFIYGILVLILGPVFVRVACEMLIVLFNINSSLNDIRNKTHG